MPATRSTPSPSSNKKQLALHPSSGGRKQGRPARVIKPTTDLLDSIEQQTVKLSNPPRLRPSPIRTRVVARPQPQKRTKRSDATDDRSLFDIPEDATADARSTEAAQTVAERLVAEGQAGPQPFPRTVSSVLFEPLRDDPVNLAKLLSLPGMEAQLRALLAPLPPAQPVAAAVPYTSSPLRQVASSSSVPPESDTKKRKPNKTGSSKRAAKKLKEDASLDTTASQENEGDVMASNQPWDGAWEKRQNLLAGREGKPNSLELVVAWFTEPSNYELWLSQTVRTTDCAKLCLQYLKDEGITWRDDYVKLKYLVTSYTAAKNYAKGTGNGTVSAKEALKELGNNPDTGLPYVLGEEVTVAAMMRFKCKYYDQLVGVLGDSVKVSPLHAHSSSDPNANRVADLIMRYPVPAGQGKGKGNGNGKGKGKGKALSDSDGASSSDSETEEEDLKGDDGVAELWPASPTTGSPFDPFDPNIITKRQQHVRDQNEAHKVKVAERKAGGESTSSSSDDEVLEPLATLRRIQPPKPSTKGSLDMLDLGEVDVSMLNQVAGRVPAISRLKAPPQGSKSKGEAQEIIDLGSDDGPQGDSGSKASANTAKGANTRFQRSPRTNRRETMAETFGKHAGGVSAALAPALSATGEAIRQREKIEQRKLDLELEKFKHERAMEADRIRRAREEREAEALERAEQRLQEKKRQERQDEQLLKVAAGVEERENRRLAMELEKAEKEQSRLDADAALRAGLSALDKTKILQDKVEFLIKHGGRQEHIDRLLDLIATSDIDSFPPSTREAIPATPPTISVAPIVSRSNTDSVISNNSQPMSDDVVEIPSSDDVVEIPFFLKVNNLTKACEVDVNVDEVD